MNTIEFIEKSKRIFNNPNWDYGETKYVNAKTPIKIYCHALKEDGTEHGYFEQLPYSHLKGHGCAKCSKRSQKYDLDEWLIKAKRNNNYKFEFMIDEYHNQHQRIKCVCPIHGVFERTCKQVLQGTYCPQCKVEERRLKREKEIIEKCKEIHGDKYDYSKFKFKTLKDKVVVICHKKDANGVEHGEFYPQVDNHIFVSAGCPKCAIENNANKRRIEKNEIIERAKNIYGEWYDLSLIDGAIIDNVESKIEIICPIHGKFEKTIHAFLGGHGCQKCGAERIRESVRIGNEEWLRRFAEVHQGKYTYDLAQTINYESIIEISCPIHGIFRQKVGNHYHGQGCPKCRMSHLERDMMRFLNDNNIEFDYQKKFEWLGKQSLDFYLPQYNIAIECQGSQHFENDKFYKDLSVVQERDERKRKLCVENKVELWYNVEEKYIKNYNGSVNFCFSNLECIREEIKKREI